MLPKNSVKTTETNYAKATHDTLANDYKTKLLNFLNSRCDFIKNGFERNKNPN